MCTCLKHCLPSSWIENWVLVGTTARKSVTRGSIPSFLFIGGHVVIRHHVYAWIMPRCGCTALLPSSRMSNIVLQIQQIFKMVANHKTLPGILRWAKGHPPEWARVGLKQHRFCGRAFLVVVNRVHAELRHRQTCQKTEGIT